MNIRNCEKCSSSYEPYKIGKDEDAGSYFCVISHPKAETKGLCQFCNPKSIYNAKRHFYEVSYYEEGERMVKKYPLFVENGDIYIRFYAEKVLLKTFLNET